MSVGKLKLTELLSSTCSPQSHRITFNRFSKPGFSINSRFSIAWNLSTSQTKTKTIVFCYRLVNSGTGLQIQQKRRTQATHLLKDIEQMGGGTQMLYSPDVQTGCGRWSRSPGRLIFYS